MPVGTGLKPAQAVRLMLQQRPSADGPGCEQTLAEKRRAVFLAIGGGIL